MQHMEEKVRYYVSSVPLHSIPCYIQPHLFRCLQTHPSCYLVLAVALTPIVTPPPVVKMKASATKEGKAPRSLPAVFPSIQHLEPGRVILAVPDGWNGGMVVDYFRSQVCVWGGSVNGGMVVDYFHSQVCVWGGSVNGGMVVDYFRSQ